jgi:hypothetical protein
VGVRHLGTPDETFWGGPQSNDGVEVAPAGLPESSGRRLSRKLSTGGIAPRIAGIPVKSALKKISKDEQRRRTDYPHPILELETGDGVVIEQEFQDLVQHAAARGLAEVLRRAVGRMGKTSGQVKHKQPAGPVLTMEEI